MNKNNQKQKGLTVVHASQFEILLDKVQSSFSMSYEEPIDGMNIEFIFLITF